MPSNAARSSDLVEVYAARALTSGIGSAVALALTVLLWVFRGQGSLLGLAGVLAFAGVGLGIYAGINFKKSREVTSVTLECPYCQHKNGLLDTPQDDFSCEECHRMIPVVAGKILPVQQVRCGFCNELNFYSTKTEVLLCEACNHEIPIAQEEGYVSRRLAPGFAVKEDDRPYEISLISYHHKSEQLITALQQILALNRNQVKQLLDETPCVLLTGIPKRRAESLSKQLGQLGAMCDVRVI